MNIAKDSSFEKKTRTTPVNPKLLELLWKLKERHQLVSNQKVPLNKLIQDLEYRKQLVNASLTAKDEKSHELAWSIMQLEEDLQKNSAEKKRTKPKVVDKKITNVSAQEINTQVPVLKEVIKPSLEISPQNTPKPRVKNTQSEFNEPSSQEANKRSTFFERHKIPVILMSILLLAGIVAIIFFKYDSTVASEGFSSIHTKAALGENTKSKFASTIFSAPLSEHQTGNLSEKLSAAIDAKNIFTIHGSNTIGEGLAPALLRAYMKKNGATETKILSSGSILDRKIISKQDGEILQAVSLSSHGSSTGFKSLLENKADIAMSSRKIKKSEIKKLKPQYGDLTSARSEHIIGLDGLAIIVHPDNAINSLTTKQIAQLFSGEIKNWNALGGNAAGPVHVYAREKNSGTWDTFKSLVLKVNKTHLSPAAKRYESSSALSDDVSEDVGGIGFIALPYVKYSKLLSISEGDNAAAVMPTAFTIGTEDYPLSRRLYLYMPKKANNDVKSFVEFVHSKQGQDIVEKQGFVSQNIYALKPYRDKAYPKKYLALTKNAQRLSLNFRFNISSNGLDNKAKRDLNRVVDYLFKNKDRHVFLLGFTDSIGEKEQNIALSKQRVKTIEDALNTRGIFPAVSEGFGEAIPIASNHSAYGRYKNRRVEIWVE